MWNQLISTAKEIFSLSERSTRNKEDIVILRSNLEDLEDKVDQLATAIQLLAMTTCV